MRRLIIAAIAASLVAVPVWARPRIEVTRFHTPESIAAIDRAAVAVVAAPGADSASLENRVWLAAVERALAANGFGAGWPENAPTIAEVRVERRSWQPEKRGGGVSVGVGGSTGSYGSGVGLGIGIDLSGPPPEMIETTLSVTLRDKASGRPLWEGRAEQAVKAKAKEAAPEIAAERLAAAVFQAFPGRSGETISVK